MRDTFKRVSIFLVEKQRHKPAQPGQSPKKHAYVRLPFGEAQPAATTAASEDTMLRSHLFRGVPGLREVYTKQGPNSYYLLSQAQ